MPLPIPDAIHQVFHEQRNDEQDQLLATRKLAVR
jgi:hypothetical protein